MIAFWQESYGKPGQYVEKQRHYSANRGPYNQGSGLPSGHIWLWELVHKEWPKNSCLRTVVLEKTPKSTLDSKIKPVNLEGNQPWIFIGRTDAEAETPVFWSSDMPRWFIGKVPDAGTDRRQKEKRASRQKEKRASEDEVAGPHHRCNEHELGQTTRNGEWQGGLACCSPCGHKELDTLGDWTTTRVVRRIDYLSSFPGLHFKYAKWKE